MAVPPTPPARLLPRLPPCSAAEAAASLQVLRRRVAEFVPGDWPLPFHFYNNGRDIGPGVEYDISYRSAPQSNKVSDPSELYDPSDEDDSDEDGEEADDGSSAEKDKGSALENDAAATGQCTSFELRTGKHSKFEGAFEGSGEKFGCWDAFTSFSPAPGASKGIVFLNCGLIVKCGDAGREATLVRILKGTKAAGLGLVRL